MGVVQIIWGLWKRFLLALPVLKKHLTSMLYIVKLPFKYPISCIIENLEILKISIYCQYVANGKKSKVNEIINWEK
jgi:hypothetical protein